jgi:hypothetical protein
MLIKYTFIQLPAAELKVGLQVEGKGMIADLPLRLGPSVNAFVFDLPGIPA